MLLESKIPQVLINVYIETEYHVLGSETFTLRVGIASEDLRRLHVRHRVVSSAFLTAYNPYSQELSEEENVKRDSRLSRELQVRGLYGLKGLGQHPSNNWRAEASFLVLGATFSAAKEIAGMFEQNAFIWADDDVVPRLILLR